MGLCATCLSLKRKRKREGKGKVEFLCDTRLLYKKGKIGRNGSFNVEKTFLLVEVFKTMTLQCTRRRGGASGYQITSLLLPLYGSD